MKTPGQRQLITLQEQVKLGIVNVDEAVLHFKEWQLNQKKRSESFRFQQVASSATVELFHGSPFPCPQQWGRQLKLSCLTLELDGGTYL